MQCVWYYPSEVYVDKDLLTKTRYTKVDSDFGKSAQIQMFAGNRCLVRRSDGVLVSAATSPYPAVLYDMVARQQWEKATRLCRFIKDPTMWATLAAIAMAAKELNTAEVSAAAANGRQVDGRWGHRSRVAFPRTAQPFEDDGRGDSSGAQSSPGDAQGPYQHCHAHTALGNRHSCASPALWWW